LIDLIKKRKKKALSITRGGKEDVSKRKRTRYPHFPPKSDKKGGNHSLGKRKKKDKGITHLHSS